MDRALVALFLVLATGCSSGAAAPLEWVAVASGGVLRSRWFAGSVYYNNALYVFGGESSRATINGTGILGKRERERERERNCVCRDPPTQ